MDRVSSRRSGENPVGTAAAMCYGSAFRRVVSGVTLILWLLILSGCEHYFLSRMNSPLDEHSSHFAGYDTVASPGELRAYESLDTTWIVLTASRVLEAEEYRLQISPGPDFGSVLVDEGSHRTNLMQVAERLSAGGAYWRARARQAGDWGDWSAPARLEVLDPFRGNTPSGDATVETNTPTLTWHPIPRASRYEVQLAPEGSDLATATVHTVTVPRYVVAEYQPKGSYRWRVGAIDGDGARTAWSASARFTITVADTTPPGEVTSLATTAGDEEITLNWNDPDDADLAAIRLSWSPENGKAQPLTVAPGEETAIITTLDNRTTYTFTAVATDTAGNLSAPTSIIASPGVHAVVIVDGTLGDTPFSVSVSTAGSTATAEIDHGVGQFTFAWYVDGDLVDLEIEGAGTVELDLAGRDIGRYNVSIVVSDGIYLALASTVVTVAGE
jgi:hypothetical protein